MQIKKVAMASHHISIKYQGWQCIGTSRNKRTEGKLSANVHRQVTTPDIDPTRARWLELLFQVIIILRENTQWFFFIYIGWPDTNENLAQRPSDNSRKPTSEW